MYGTNDIAFLIYVIIKTDDRIFKHRLIFSWIPIQEGKKNGREYFAHLCNIMIKENTDDVT